MCLAIPSKVLEIDENNVAKVDTLGVIREVSLDLIDEEVKPGDYILIHVGYAMSKIDEKAALESLEVYKQLAEAVKDVDFGDIEPERLVNEDGPLLYKPKADDETNS